MQFDCSTLGYINFYNFSPISEVQKGRGGGGCDVRKGDVRKDELITLTTPRLTSHGRGGGGMITLVSYHHQKIKMHSYTFTSMSEPSSSTKSVTYFCGFCETVQVGGQLYSPGRVVERGQ